MSLAAVIASPLLKSAMELLLPVVHDVLGGGKAADKLVGQIKLKAMELDGERIAAQQQILRAELEGSWIQRNWRPIAMMTFVFILCFQTVVIPVVNAFYPDAISQDMMLVYKVIEVIMIGLGGYIVGRSGEKIADTVMTNKRAAQQLEIEREDGLKPRAMPAGAQVDEPPFMQAGR